ncbi:hypothetical protein EV714DRAFT_276694 [Schizophyllum commune]
MPQSKKTKDSVTDYDDPLSASPKKATKGSKERRSTSVTQGKKRMIIDSMDEVEEAEEAEEPPPPRKAKKTYQKSEEEKKKCKCVETSSSGSEDDVRLSHHSPPKKQKTASDLHPLEQWLSSLVCLYIRGHAIRHLSCHRDHQAQLQKARSPNDAYEYTSTSGLSTKAKLAQAKPAQGRSLPSFTKKSKQQKEAESASTPVGAGRSSAGPSTGGMSQAASGPPSAGSSKPAPLPKRKVPLPRRKDSGSLSAPPPPRLDMDVDQRPEPAPMDLDEPEVVPMEVDHKPVPPPRLKQAAPPFPPAELDSFECTKPIDLVLGASDEPQHVCNMHLFNLTVRRNDTVMPFKVGHGPLDRVVLGRFHDYTDLPLLLQAPLGLCNSMGQVAIIRFCVFEEWIGNIILFPSSAVRVGELFEWPAYYQRDDILFAALVPWRIVPVPAKPDEHVSMCQCNEATPSLRSQPVPPVQMSSDMKTDLSSRWTVMKGRYQEALHVLQFPKRRALDNLGAVANPPTHPLIAIGVGIVAILRVAWAAPEATEYRAWQAAHAAMPQLARHLSTAQSVHLPNPLCPIVTGKG